MEKEATLYRKLEGRKVECTACARLCKIPEGAHGFCFVRRNRGGRLYLANYGLAEAVQVDPIEKKPFNHFMPGAYVLGIGTSSCNFGCLFCQNHSISKKRDIRGMELEPEWAVELALEQGVQGIAYTYNEPTIFIEYALDTARLARRKGLKNVWVSNGYMTEDSVREMKGLVDAVVVDFKGSGEQKFANKYETVQSEESIKEALLWMKKAKIHIEITDLIIPQVGDSLKACGSLTKWIAKDLGRDTPTQFTRFHPDYRMLDFQETPYSTLKTHYDTARRNGLNYVYIGNVPGNRHESTYCPGCHRKVIGRLGFGITEWNIDARNRCVGCGREIPIEGERARGLSRRRISVLY